MAIKAPKVFGNRGSTNARLTGGKSITNPSGGASPFDDDYDPAASPTGSPGTGWDAPMGSFDDMTPEEIMAAQKRRQFDEMGAAGKAKVFAKGLITRPTRSSSAGGPPPAPGRVGRAVGAGVGNAATLGRALGGDPTAQLELAQKAARAAESRVGQTWNAYAVGANHVLGAAWSQDPNKAMLMSGNSMGQSADLGEWRHQAKAPKLPGFKPTPQESQAGESSEAGGSGGSVSRVGERPPGAEPLDDGNPWDRLTGDTPSAPRTPVTTDEVVAHIQTNTPEQDAKIQQDIKDSRSRYRDYNKSRRVIRS